MPTEYEVPCSPREEIEGLIYFRRLCDKIRKHQNGTLHPDYQGNLGIAMDQWTCQFLGVEYAELREQVEAGADDQAAYTWALENGISRPDFEKDWFTAYILTRGFRDNLSERLAERKKEDPKTDRDDILSFADYIDIDEGRELLPN